MGLRLKKGGTILLALAAVLLVVTMVALWQVDSRYEAVFRAPRITHDAFTTGDTSVKVVVRPPLGRRNLSDALLPNRRVPDWVLSAVVPEEVALLFDANLDAGHMRVSFFTNYARLGPALRDALNRQNVAAALPDVVWSPPEVVRKEKGVLLLEGTVDLPRNTSQAIAMKWGTVSQPPPRVEGDHFLEAVMENRNGKGYAVILGLLGDSFTSNPMLALAMSPDSFYVVGQMRLTGDFTATDTMTFQLEVDANPASPPESSNGLKLAVDALYGQLRAYIKEAYDGDLSGTSTVAGRTVRGEYTLLGADKVLMRLVQGQQTEVLRHE